ncbi:sensor histidine kinase KdpD [Methylophilus sp. 14]|uniref:sensor histidine kinase n=1 Tax=Methylophilus sp. 14 TaxID=2781019 RepID=UPI0018900E78|nr:sensor histidine kinase KdpD [Methylophilus sp. 14]MBF4987085.1 sensor histidine kinase KdpD [Methylophilus sp. 14]
MNKSPVRPNPDQLLKQLDLENQKSLRGKLKIFFGSSAGVGKTCAMLNAAHTLHKEHVHVLVGVIETHGRSETALRAQGLPSLPLKEILYRGKKLKEFDIDEALRSHPTVILVDELAHSNVEGSRHKKRWQDVEELLSSGIDVYTTVNVQHIESLNDIVAQITGVKVQETIPDSVFDLADEVVLIDLPPEELLQRLDEGRIYIPEQAQKASKHFFRKGNLIALRELALRRTADRVDAQMQEYRQDQAIQHVWQANERILVGIGPSKAFESLIRTAARLAQNMKADWLVVYVETPALQNISMASRKQITELLRLAQSLGATTANLSGDSVTHKLVEYAQSHNVSRIVIGKPTRSILSRFFHPSVSDELAKVVSDIDVHIVMRGREKAVKGSKARPGLDMRAHFSDEKKKGYVWALIISAITSLVASVLLPYFELANIIMLYLLGVMLISIRYGRGPGIASSFLSVSIFDFFFVPPRFSFTVADTQYLLTFAIMLSVALVISNLTSSLRKQAIVANYRERRSLALYEVGKELASALTTGHIVEVSTHHVAKIFNSKVAILTPDANEQLEVAQTNESSNAALQETTLLDVDLGIAQWTYDRQQQSGLGTDTLPSSKILYIPLKAPMRTRGVLAISPENNHDIYLPEHRQLLDTFASQIGLALERKHYVEIARDAVISMETERLRNSLLSAISHDLRTPLTSIIATTEQLKETISARTHAFKMLTGLHDQAIRMQNLVLNLLDMARLQSGTVKLNSEWHLLEEIVGSAINGLQTTLQQHRVVVTPMEDIPLLYVDAILIERVLSNLLDNACKYSDAGTTITISAKQQGGQVSVTFSDEGQGLPPGMETSIFQKFTRGKTESTIPGVGLGLSICKAIIEAHGGKIWADKNEKNGTTFTFTLPVKTPPTVSEMEI